MWTRRSAAKLVQEEGQTSGGGFDETLAHGYDGGVTVRCSTMPSRKKGMTMRVFKRTPKTAYDSFDVIDFILGIFSVFNGLVLIINNVIDVISQLFDDTDA